MVKYWLLIIIWKSSLNPDKLNVTDTEIRYKEINLHISIPEIFFFSS